MTDNKQQLLKYLQSHDLMIIATSDDKPSAATVYYGVDDNFNFYIITPPSTEHGKNILKNHRVACVVVDTNQRQFETTHKIGVQIYGDAELITNLTEIKEALSVWGKKRQDMVDIYTKNIMEKVWQSRPFRIKPQWIKWFNEKLYGDEGTEVFKF